MKAKKKFLGIALICGVLSSVVSSVRPLLLTSLTTEDHWTRLLPSLKNIPLLHGISNFQILLSLEILDFCVLLSSGLLLAKFSSLYALELRLRLNESIVSAMSRGDTDVLSRFTSYLKTYVETVEEYLKISLVPSFTAILTILASLFFTTQIHNSISILIGCEIIVLLIVTLIYGHFFAKVANLRFKADEIMLDNASVDVKKGIAIWFSGIAPLWARHRVNDVTAVAAARYKLGKLEATYFNGTVFIIGIFLCLGYLVIVRWQSLPPQTFLAYALYAGFIMGPVARFCAFFPETRQFLIAMSALKPALAHPEDPKLLGELKINACGFVNGKISLDPLLIEASDRILIGGASGSGKTSILYALVGLRSDVFKEVTINGVESRVLASWLPDIGVFYLSDTPAFESGTIIENFSVPEEELIDCFVKFKLFPSCTADENTLFLNRKIDSAGLPLSLGERQRLQLARTLIRSPRVLILDEALSGVSEEGEKEIVQSMINETAIEILIYVSHRSSIQKIFSKSVLVQKLDRAS